MRLTKKELERLCELTFNFDAYTALVLKLAKKYNATCTDVEVCAFYQRAY